MIKWYKPSEKMPKIDDAVCVYRTVNAREIIEFIRFEIINYWEPSDFDEIESMGDTYYWAYASDFNFPSEVKNE